MPVYTLMTVIYLLSVQAQRGERNRLTFKFIPCSPNLPASGPAPAQTFLYCYYQPGDRRVVRTVRRFGEVKRHLNLRRRIHRGTVPGQDGIKTRTECVNHLRVTRRSLRAGGAEAHF